jgi:hypothetical protein
MSDYSFLFVIAIWIVLQLFVFPRAGVSS